MTEAPLPSQEKTSDTLNRLLASTGYLNGLLLLLIVAVVSFHPWVVAMVEKALDITPLLLLVLIFVYVMNPMVEFVLRQMRRVRQFERFSYDRSLVVTYLLLLVILGVILALLVPKLARELQTLAENLPGFAQRFQAALAQYRDRYFEALPLPVKDQVSKGVGEIGSAASSLIQGGLKYAGAFSQTVLWALGALILVPLIGFYILKDGSRMLDFLVGFAPVHQQGRSRRILLQIHDAMQNFVKGQSILCLVIGVVTMVAMAFVLPQYSIALGLVAGITEAIPVVGPFLGAIPAVIIAFALPEQGGPGLAAIVIVIYLGIQQLENVVLVPRVMGESLGLHPLSLILGMMVFGNIFGFWGVVLSAPLVATVKILVMHLRGEEVSPPPVPPPPSGRDASPPVAPAAPSAPVPPVGENAPSTIPAPSAPVPPARAAAPPAPSAAGEATRLGKRRKR